MIKKVIPIKEVETRIITEKPTRLKPMPHDDNATNKEAISAIFDLNNILAIIYVLIITEVPNVAENNLAATTVGPNTATNGRSKYW